MVTMGQRSHAELLIPGNSDATSFAVTIPIRKPWLCPERLIGACGATAFYEFTALTLAAFGPGEQAI